LRALENTPHITHAVSQTQHEKPVVALPLKQPLQRLGKSYPTNGVLWIINSDHLSPIGSSSKLVLRDRPNTLQRTLSHDSIISKSISQKGIENRLTRIASAHKLETEGKKPKKAASQESTEYTYKVKCTVSVHETLLQYDFKTAYQVKKILGKEKYKEFYGLLRDFKEKKMSGDVFLPRLYSLYFDTLEQTLGKEKGHDLAKDLWGGFRPFCSSKYVPLYEKMCL
jgi:hypothetical protein